MDRNEILMMRLSQLLNEIRQYVGARYVPRFIEGGWDATQAYEALDVVDNGQGTSYIAKKPVPVGTPLRNREYWFVYGASSGAIINLQNQIDAIVNNTIPEINSQIQTIANDAPAINVKHPDESTGLDGAAGDGVTDDTAAINAIMQYALAHDRNVYFPKGTYLISSVTISYSSSHKTVNIYGAGVDSVIKSSGDGIIFINTTEASFPNNMVVEKLKFVGASRSGTKLLQMINIFNGVIRDCYFTNAENGLLLISNLFLNVINCRIDDMAYDGCAMIGNTVDDRALYVGNNTVNCFAVLSRNNGHDGFNCIGNSGCNFYGCTSEANGHCGIYAEKSGGFNGAGNLISGCWFEFNIGGHIYIDSTNEALDCNHTIESCGFVLDTTMTTNGIVMSGDNSAILVSGCHFRRVSGSRESMGYARNIRCIHNRFSYTPSYNEISGEYGDMSNCVVNADGTLLNYTRSITGCVKNNDNTYTISINHWIRYAAASSDNLQCIASLNVNNAGDGTCTITVAIRDTANMAIVSTPFYLIAM